MDAGNLGRLHRVLDTGDLELRFHDGRSIKAHSLKLKIASLDGVLHNLIEDVVDEQITGNKRKRSSDSDRAADLPGLTVDGEYEDWLEVLKLIYHSDVYSGLKPAEMSRETAYRLFPIVHQYGMELMAEWCAREITRNPLPLWPSEPITSSEVPNHPGLVQCLALADAKQCDSLVQACLSQLIKPEGSSGGQMIRQALVSPSLNLLVGSLRPETKDKIILRFAGLPADFKATFPSLGQVKPSITADINTVDWDEPVCKVQPYIAMSDRLVLFPNNKTSTKVWDMLDDRSVGVLEGHTASIISAKINNDGSMAVTIAGDADDAELYAVKIWSLGTMQSTANLMSTADEGVAILKDRLLLGSEDGPIKVWDIGGSTPVALLDLDEHTDIIWSITASDTSNVALSGSHDESVRLWDLRTGQCVRVMEGQDDMVKSVSMDSTCKTAVSGSPEGVVKLWDLGSGRCSQTYKFKGYIHNVIMHESGGSFLVASGDVFFHAYSTVAGYNDHFISDVDLSSMCDSTSEHYPSVVASRDWSKVGMCCLKSADDRLLGMSVWK